MPAVVYLKRCSTSLLCLQAQRHQMLQTRVSLQEQQMQVQKQALQLHQAGHPTPGLGPSSVAGQPTPSTAPSTAPSAAPAVAPAAPQADQPGHTQS